ncbi:MAG: hypothetical protein HFG07_09165 [Oscillibacter sp.]|nr:hypothetical protein [Oscillibacter sp.]
MHDLGLFSSLGEAWVAVLRTIYQQGAAVAYTDNAGEHAGAKEVFGLTFAVSDAALPDAIIERHKVQEEYDWMVRNFTVQEHVKELHNETSYAFRLFSYMDQKDQLQWVIHRLNENPHTRSATITTFEPLTDEGYILRQPAGLSRGGRKPQSHGLLPRLGFRMQGLHQPRDA